MLKISVEQNEKIMAQNNELLFLNKKIVNTTEKSDNFLDANFSAPMPVSDDTFFAVNERLFLKNREQPNQENSKAVNDLVNFFLVCLYFSFI